MNIVNIVKFLRYAASKSRLFVPVKKDLELNITPERGNQLIFELLTSRQPLMISRLGTSEANVIATYMFLNKYKQLTLLKKIKTMYNSGVFEWSENTLTGITRNAGFFPKDVKEIEKFAGFFGECLEQTDVLGCWQIAYEKEIIDQYIPNVRTVPLVSIEPYYFNDPWSSYLRGKKVLVIHPFSESIKKQYKKRKVIFKNEVLPDFELLTIKAVQSAAYERSKFKTWFDAYNWMCSEIDKKEFDIAIIGAGAYGLPLAAYVKKIGKQSVHMGGATQILFGIKGKRWEKHQYISKLFNENWTIPDLSEIPQQSEIIEGGCYW